MTGFTLVASVLGTSSEYERDQSALALLDWGFSEFHLVTPVRAGEVFARRDVPYEVAPAMIAAQHGYQTVVARNAHVRIQTGRLRRLVGADAQGRRRRTPQRCDPRSRDRTDPAGAGEEAPGGLRADETSASRSSDRLRC